MPVSGHTLLDNQYATTPLPPPCQIGEELKALCVVMYSPEAKPYDNKMDLKEWYGFQFFLRKHWNDITIVGDDAVWPPSKETGSLTKLQLAWQARSLAQQADFRKYQ